MSGDSYLWPYSADSVTPAKSIDWISIKPSIMTTVKPQTLRRVNREHLIQLKDRFAHLWETLSQENQEVVMARIQERPETKKKREEVVRGEGDVKSKIKSMIGEVLDSAEAAGDLTAQLNSIKLLADIEALLRQKPEEKDAVINIYVNTGVTRGNN